MNQSTEENKIENSQITIERKAYPSIGQGWGLIGILILVTIAYSIPIGILSFLKIDIQSGPFLLLNYTIPMLLLIAVVRNLWKKNPKNTKMLSFKSFPIAILPVVVAMVLGILLINIEISSWVPMPDILVELFKDMIQPNIWGFLTIVIAAPILEELILRGIVLEGLLRNYSPWKAIVWSAVFFGVIHLNPWQFVTAFIAGVTIGYLYWKTKSLLLCMIIHAINNGIAFFLTVKYPDVSNFADVFEIGIIGRVVLFFGALLIIWASYLFYEKFFQDQVKLKE